MKSNHSIIVVRTPGQVQAAIINQLEQLYLRAESSGQTNDINTKVFQKHNQDVINEALVLLIVVRNLPFRIVNWPEFHAFCQVLNPESVKYITTAHSQVSKRNLSNRGILRKTSYDEASIGNLTYSHFTLIFGPLQVDLFFLGSLLILSTIERSI